MSLEAQRSVKREGEQPIREIGALLGYAALMGTKAVAIAIALGAVGVGVALRSSWGAGLQAALNKDYARLPGKFQYPDSWHRFIGALFIAFGLLVAVVGLTAAH